MKIRVARGLFVLLGIMGGLALCLLTATPAQALAPSDYPPHPSPPAGVYYAKQLPSGAFVGQSPKAIILMLHKGGWGGYQIPHVQAMAPRASLFNSWGYETIAADYGPGQYGLIDIVAFYDWAVTSGLPVCAYGESAGAHMSMMLSVVRPSLTCVIAAAGPMDLNKWANRGLAADKFDDLTEWSPDTYGTNVAAHVLLGYALNDATVDVSQGTQEKSADPAVQLITLNPVDNRDNKQVLFVHSNVAQAQLDDWWRKVHTYLATSLAP